MIVNLVVIPVDIAFFHGTQSTGWLVFHSLFDTFFMMDLLLNFRTGIMPGKTRTDGRMDGRMDGQM